MKTEYIGFVVPRRNGETLVEWFYRYVMMKEREKTHANKQRI